MKRFDIVIRKNPLLEKLKRGPQVILPKDFGMIAAYTGIGKKSKVVEAGAGSGWLTVMLANICKQVYTYEKEEEFYTLAKKNLERAEMKNVKLRLGNIMEGIKEKNIDAVILDMAESNHVIPLAHKALKEGGFLVGYLPNVEQMKDFYLAAESLGFKEIFAKETIDREWLVRDFGVRPNTKGLTHTAFLVFARK